VQPPRFDGREAAERVATPGVAVGLVWTEVGGEVLFVESTAMLGKGDLHLTGQLGDVIKESAQIALTWVNLAISCLHIFISLPLISGLVCSNEDLEEETQHTIGFLSPIPML